MRLTDRRFAWLLMLPAALFFAAFVAYPVVRLVWDSLHDVALLSPDDRTFVGLANYVDAISSERVRGAAWRTLAYTGIALTGEFVIGFAVALLFSAFGRKSEIPRVIFILPLMVPPVVAGLLWRFLLIDDFGIVNELLARVGILESRYSIAWLSNPDIVLFSVAFPDIWMTTAFVALVVYAGLQTIPDELLEAAHIDGASAWQTLWRIKVPLLRPVLAVVLVIRGIDAARAFDVILVQTGGGPQFASEVLSLQIFRQMIRYGDLGSASATATLFMLVMVVLAVGMFLAIWRPGQLRR